MERLCFLKQTEADCLSGEARTKCVWNYLEGIGGLCEPRADPELLQIVFCNNSIAFDWELCTSVEAQEACENYTQCAYDTSSPLPVLGASLPWTTLGPCRPADWVETDPAQIQNTQVCIEAEKMFPK